MANIASLLQQAATLSRDAEYQIQRGLAQLQRANKLRAQAVDTINRVSAAKAESAALRKAKLR